MSNIPIRELRDKVTKEVFYPKTHVKAVAGLEDITFFELAIVNGQHTVKLKDDYAGLWANGFGTFGGLGTGGGGGGGGASYLNDLQDVSISNPSSNDVLLYNGNSWTNTPISSIANLTNGSSYSSLTVNGVSTNFYTKSQVDTLISTVNSFEYVVVSTLPTASASTMGKMYLVPSSNPSTPNAKDTYVTIRDGSYPNYTYSWEQIGSTNIDLSGYVQTSRKVNGHALTSDVTVTKGDLGLGNVENTAISTWAGSQNITTLGTIASGVWNGTAIGVTNGGTGLTSITKGAILYASAANTIAQLSANGTSTKKFLSQTNDGSPSWDTISKSDVGLSNVENTKLSTWVGSSNITTLGTISSGSIPLSLLAGADDLKAIEAISGTSGFLKKTAANTWSLDTNTYLTQENCDGRYLRLSGGTMTGDIVLNGASIYPNTDSSQTLGSSQSRFADGNIRNIHITTLDFRDGTTPSTVVGGIYCEATLMMLMLGASAANGSYSFAKTSGFYHSGNGAVDCGKSDHRWSGVYSVSADLSGSLTFTSSSTSKKMGLISAQDGYMFFRAGTDIDSSYKQLTLNPTFGLYPESSGLNLGYNGTNYRWSTIYGVNGNLTGDLTLASTSHIDLGPVRLEYDSTNDALHVTTNDSTNHPTIGLYADGFVAAGGIGHESEYITYVRCSSQSQYDAITTKSDTTMYYVGDPASKIYLGTILIYSEN